MKRSFAGRAGGAAVALGGALLLAAPTAAAQTGPDSTALTVVGGVSGEEVDVYVGDERVLRDVGFGEISAPVRVPAGDQVLELRPAGAEPDEDPVNARAVALPAGGAATVVHHVDENGLQRISPFADDGTAVAPGTARLVVRHLAGLPAADVQRGGRDLFTDVANGESADAVLAPGRAPLELTLAGRDETVLGPADVELRDGQTTAVYVVGSGRDDDVRVVVQQGGGGPAPTAAPPAVPASATLTILHGIPGIPFDLYLDGERRLTGFGSGSASEPIVLTPGRHSIEVRETGSQAREEPVLEDSFSLQAGANTSLVAHLTESGFPTLSTFVNDLSPVGPGQARLTVRHAAAMGAGEVRAGGTPVFTDLRNGGQQSAVVPAGTATAELFEVGGDAPVLGPAAIALPAGSATFVYAVGSPEDGTAELLVQTVAGTPVVPDGGVPAGSGGLKAPGGLPAWLVAVVVVAGLATLASGARLARRPA